MASKEKQAIVVDHVHSKRESRGEQPFGNHCCYHSVHCLTYYSGACRKISYDDQIHK